MATVVATDEDRAIRQQCSDMDMAVRVAWELAHRGIAPVEINGQLFVPDQDGQAGRQRSR